MSTFKNRQAFTLTEMMVVVALSAVVLLGATKIMNRTTVSFKRGSDLMNTQIILDNIVERFRSDVRTMIRYNEDKCKDKSELFSCNVRYDDGLEAEITYTFEKNTKTLKRKEVKTGRETNFHCPGKIENLAFIWVKPPAPAGAAKGELPFAVMAIQVVSDDPGEGKSVTLPFICSFHQKCIENRLPFVPASIK